MNDQDQQFLAKIRADRELHLCINNLVVLARRVIAIEEKLGMKNDEKENQASG